MNLIQSKSVLREQIFTTYSPMWLFLLWSENFAEYSCVHFVTPLNHLAWYFAETSNAAIASMHTALVIALVPIEMFWY